MTEQAVQIGLDLDGEGLPTSEQVAAVRRLERSIEAAIAADDTGELDGDEFGGGQVTLYLYGPDADRLLASVEQLVKDFPAADRWAELRYGDLDDPSALERRIQL
ncbi:DUF695 domain-containing protein [Actinoplanes palleronii]|uniref:Uncharacterized protein n=1 Tax=Actinoplanes palleronii TaxID=113570 RepID=A0ABQ4BRD2_9ACTN|nr:DUF695 domain-containing protein [Actinoplanes palleronii]GIE73234.1 hypothetical protein Apa02nite_093420 [Actinoplanes palleronii]